MWRVENGEPELETWNLEPGNTLLAAGTWNQLEHTSCWTSFFPFPAFFPSWLAPPVLALLFLTNPCDLTGSEGLGSQYGQADLSYGWWPNRWWPNIGYGSENLLALTLRGL